VLSVIVCALPAIAQQTLPPAEGDAPAAAPTVEVAAPASSPAATAPAIAVKVKEVNLLATVRDKKGQAVNNLDKKDFVLEQDGRAESITQFAHESDLPLTVGILADTGPSQRRAMADERKAGADFLNRLLRANKDKGFVLHFDKEVELLQDVTASHDKLAKGIDQISVGDAPRSGGKRDDGNSQTPHYYFGGGMLYDAIFLSSDEVLKGTQGRKAMVLFSDGVDHDSKTSLERAIESAQRADTLVYCVYVAPEREERPEGQQNGGGRRAGGGYPGGGGPFPGGGGGGPFPGGGGGPFPGGGGGRRRGPDSTSHENKTDGKKILQQISNETGGRYFELSKKLTAAQIYEQIEAEMRHQYSLSYTPDKAENGYHKLHLSTRNTELTVQARAGFYAE
jgi:VWFA-related protein